MNHGNFAPKRKDGERKYGVKKRYCVKIILEDLTSLLFLKRLFKRVNIVPLIELLSLLVSKNLFLYYIKKTVQVRFSKTR